MVYTLNDVEDILANNNKLGCLVCSDSQVISPGAAGKIKCVDRASKIFATPVSTKANVFEKQNCKSFKDGNEFC